MNNRWNEIIYKWWSPIYDKFFNSGKFHEARKRIFADEIFRNNQRILFVGIGTGADLEQINYRELDITAIDYSNEMLGKAKGKFLDSPIQFLKMDAQHMDFPDDTFDVVVGGLVLSVVPDPDKCLKEMIRTLRPNGKIIIFDKFAPKGEALSPVKQLIRPFIRLFGTDIGVHFEQLYEDNNKNLVVVEDLPIMFNGMYRKIVINKKGA